MTAEALVQTRGATRLGARMYDMVLRTRSTRHDVRQMQGTREGEGEQGGVWADYSTWCCARAKHKQHTTRWQQEGFFLSGRGARVEVVGALSRGEMVWLCASMQAVALRTHNAGYIQTPKAKAYKR